MENIKQNLLQIAPHLFKESPVLFAYLYGSYAKGQPHPFSDLDIAIYVEGKASKASLDLELYLSTKMDELLNHTVSSDIRTLNHLPLTVQGNILTHCQLIYEQDSPKRIQYETQIRMAYFDFLPIIKQHQKACRQKLLAEAQNDFS